MLKSVDRKQRNVKAASTVRVNAKMVFKRERKVFISLFHVVETWRKSGVVNISLDSGFRLKRCPSAYRFAVVSWSSSGGVIMADDLYTSCFFNFACGESRSSSFRIIQCSL